MLKLAISKILCVTCYLTLLGLRFQRDRSQLWQQAAGMACRKEAKDSLLRTTTGKQKSMLRTYRCFSKSKPSPRGILP